MSNEKPKSVFKYLATGLSGLAVAGAISYILWNRKENHSSKTKALLFMTEPVTDETEDEPHASREVKTSGSIEDQSISLQDHRYK